MDPLKSIGQILTGNEERDAIHMAVMPVIAGSELFRGQRIAIKYGTSNVAIPSFDEYYTYGQAPSVGIVDPFLSRDAPDHNRVRPGEWFWMFLQPNTITGIRHQWTHPTIDHPAQSKNESELWLHQFAEQWSFDYDQMISAATNPDDEDPYITAYGRDLHSREELGDDHDLFWFHLGVVTRRVYDTPHRNKVTWTCTC